MKKSILTALVLIGLLAAALFGYRYLSERYRPSEPAGKMLSQGKDEEKETAADFTVCDGEGSEVKLSDYLGKPVVINFWATWCGPCKSELPAFDKLSAEYSDKAVFMMVNLTDGSRDTVESVKGFVSDNGYNFPVYFDTEYSSANAYGVSSIPMSIFIDEEGKLVDTHIGSMNEDTLRGYINELLEEEK